MEIIRKGSIDKVNVIIEFECDNCGCIFKANKEEYETFFDSHNDCYYVCNCPDCGYVVYETE